MIKIKLVAFANETKSPLATLVSGPLYRKNMEPKIQVK